MYNKTCKRGRALGTGAIGYINVALFMGKLYKTIWRQEINGLVSLEVICCSFGDFCTDSYQMVLQWQSRKQNQNS